jgi:hypothetical protein
MPSCSLGNTPAEFECIWMGDQARLGEVALPRGTRTNFDGSSEFVLPGDA